MALNPSGAISLAGPSTGESIAVELGVSATATISLNDTNVRTLAGVASGVIVMPTDFYGKSNSILTQKAIFGYGGLGATPSRGIVNGPVTSVTNLISSVGVVASDTPGVGTARAGACGVGYGGDKGIFAFGDTTGSINNTQAYNYVSNTGVVSSDSSATGPVARSYAQGAIYGSDKGVIFGGFPGGNPSGSSQTNFITNTGVVGASSLYPTAGTKGFGFGLSYGGNNDKGMVGLGSSGPQGFPLGSSGGYNLISNTGVIAAPVAIAPGTTLRTNAVGAAYGGDKGIVAFGSQPVTPFLTNVSNLVSNTGVIATDTPGVGTARNGLAASLYGNNKAIFGFGYNPSGSTSISNLVSNTGVIATDTPGVGTARAGVGGVGYSLTA